MKSKSQGHCYNKPMESKPAPRPHINKQHEMFIKVVELKDTMYSDQTEIFPYLSGKGMRYIMIAYHTDANYIFSEPMRNRTEYQMLKTYDNFIMWMKTSWLGTKKHVLDNDISTKYKVAIKANGATHKLVPSGEQRRNIAEKSIQTYRNHFVGLFDIPRDSFPMDLWCRLLPQAEM